MPRIAAPPFGGGQRGISVGEKLAQFVPTLIMNCADVAEIANFTADLCQKRGCLCAPIVQLLAPCLRAPSDIVRR